VTGLTYNLINPSTNYQSGVDWHLDWGASQIVSKQVFFGAVGYFYEQITPDGNSAITRTRIAIESTPSCI
jgi:hypothetical protein